MEMSLYLCLSPENTSTKGNSKKVTDRNGFKAVDFQRNDTAEVYFDRG